MILTKNMSVRLNTPLAASDVAVSFPPDSHLKVRLMINCYFLLEIETRDGSFLSRIFYFLNTILADLDEM